MEPMTEHFDVIIVGAGLSGVTAAYHLQKRCPGKSFAILEARAAMGGTWDLFRYPGVRSDSDMFTLGFRWRPWSGAKAIAAGADILAYIRDAAREQGIDRHIRYQQHVTRAVWSSERARWTLELARGGEHGSNGERGRLSCKFLYMCSGYYDYDAGYTPEFPGQEAFAGRVVHPQHWPSDLDWAGKRVVVIGSGATAMTLVPALAEKAAHVTLVQRSPTYIVSRPAVDGVARALRSSLPPKAAYDITRWKNIALGAYFFALSRHAPKRTKNYLLKLVREQLGSDQELEQHFTPRYGVWDQRVCLVPDGDLFETMRAGRVSMVTDHIERFTEDGIALQSGQQLGADLIITATGLELQFLGGVELEVDGVRVEANQLLTYKDCMFSDVPNLAATFGYSNASWTLKADLTAEYICRVLRTMDAQGAVRCTPRVNDPRIEARPFMDLASGYVQRGEARMPKQASRRPFRLYQNYWLDMLILRFGRILDGALEFSPARAHATETVPNPEHPRHQL
jgi:cation diffusion facilitator CzcD-associated flavoprotein CzcO